MRLAARGSETVAFYPVNQSNPGPAKHTEETATAVDPDGQARGSAAAADQGQKKSGV